MCWVRSPPTWGSAATTWARSINVNDFSTYVAVRRELAPQTAARLNAGRIKGKAVKVRLLTGQDTAWA